MNLLSELNREQQLVLKKFILQVAQAKLLNEIEKMYFCSETDFLRFLLAENFDCDQALLRFRDHVIWRRTARINQVIDNEEIPEDKIKQHIPNTFHFCDQSGRPLWLFQLGKMRLVELLQTVSELTLKMFFVKELEHSLRERMQVTKGDQLIILIDMKGTTVKQLANKRTLQVLKDLVLSHLPSQYPELVHTIMLVNTPIFFEQIYITEIAPLLSKRSASKIIISGERDATQLGVDELPAQFGGTIIDQKFSFQIERGPWTNELEFDVNKEEEEQKDPLSQQFKMMVDESEDLLGG